MKKDYDILRELAKQYTEVCADPKNGEYKRLWHKLNALRPERPMFIIDELPWRECNIDGSLTLQCENETCRMIEQELRRLLFRKKYLHDDYVFEPYLFLPKRIHGIEADLLKGLPMDYGIHIEEDTVSTHDDPEGVISHHYHDQIQTPEDLKKLRCPDIRLDETATERIETIANESVGDILRVCMEGFTPWYSGWDMMIQWRSVENVMMSIMDEPEFMHQCIRKILDVSLQCLDKLEAQGLLGLPARLVHSCGAWTDELPMDYTDKTPLKADQLWTFGMAQILYTVSPRMHNEFEFEYAKEWYGRFGLGYYGCCEPLEDRMDYVKQIPNIRKISCSHWVKSYEKFSEQLERKYVMSVKPSPAHLVGSFDEKAIRAYLQHRLNAANAYGTPCEFALKDISTIEGHVERLGQWSDLMRGMLEA